MKSKVDQLDVDKSLPVPVDLRKLSDIVKNDVAKKDVYNLVKKTDYSTKISEIEKKITDHNHDKYITTSEFNKFMAEIFDLKS